MISSPGARLPIRCTLEYLALNNKEQATMGESSEYSALQGFPVVIQFPIQWGDLEAKTLCFWGQAKLFGLLRISFGGACSVCSQEAEKICSTLGLRGKPSASVSEGEPNSGLAALEVLSASLHAQRRLVF